MPPNECTNWELRRLAQPLAKTRYEDARRAFEATIQMAPMRPAAHSGLAELRLMQGLEAGQALENVRRARQLQADRKCLGSIWADEAWALAMLGQSSEAQQAWALGAVRKPRRDADAQERVWQQVLGLADAYAMRP